MYLRWHHFRWQKHVPHLHSLFAKKKDILDKPRGVDKWGAEGGGQSDWGRARHRKRLW